VSFSRYDAVDDPYCYRGIDCLKNKLGLRDPVRLEAFELEMSSLRAQEPLPAGRFGPSHYRRVHWHLFQDVYRWAGQYRTIATAKGGNWFCYPEFIERELKKLSRRLKDAPFAGGSEKESFVVAAAEFLAELNAIHPFREGNGRAQLSFLHLVALRAGYPLDLARIRRDTFLPAMVTSFAGDTGPLVTEMRGLVV
jgi:cell filamentation protein